MTNQNKRINAVILNNTSVNNHHGCKIVMEQIHKYCKKYGMDIIHNVKIKEDWPETGICYLISTG